MVKIKPSLKYSLFFGGVSNLKCHSFCLSQHVVLNVLFDFVFLNVLLSPACCLFLSRYVEEMGDIYIYINKMGNNVILFMWTLYEMYSFTAFGEISKGIEQCVVFL